MRTASLPLIVAASLVAVACQTKDLTNPGGGPGGGPNPKITAQVSATDVSRPSGPGGSTVNATGTVTFTGLTVELWNGQQWLTVANGSGSASLKVGDGSAAATLVPATEIPAGDYSKARVSATSAAIDITLDGQGFSARVENPNAGPLVLEKTVSVTVNPDGSRTFRIELQLIRTVTLGSGTSGPEVQLAGDLGALTVPAVTAPARVLAADVSQPTDASGAPVNVTGTVTFTGLTVELWDGQQWLAVANGSGSAAVTIGDGSAAATLVPTAEIAAGQYTKVRIGATETVAQLTAVLDGQEFAAQIKPPSDQPFVIEKDVMVTVNADGSRTFQVRLELVRTVTLVSDPTTGVARLSVTGELTGTP